MIGWRAIRHAGQMAQAHARLRDVVTGSVVSVFALLVPVLGIHDEPSRAPRLAEFAAAAAVIVAMVVRRRWPGWAIGVVAGAAVLLSTSGHEQPVLVVTMFLLFYGYAGREDRPARGRVWVAATAAAGLLYAAGVGWGGGGWWSTENLGVFAWIGMATAIGDAGRSRRAYIAEVEQRALRAEQTRDAEARRRVAEERLRIARDLHDVVAHHIAVIKVQARGAQHLLVQQPERAGPALGHISRAADAVLTEIAAVIGILRNPDLSGDCRPGEEMTPGDRPGDPARGLAMLGRLLDDAAGGLSVEHRQHGIARPLPALVDLAAYRIVQEALTNARKHGTGKVQLTIGYTPDSVTATVSNTARPAGPMPHPAADPDGAPRYGLIGMRERATAAGGTVTAELMPGGRFVVEATLPAPPGQPAQQTDEPAQSQRPTTPPTSHGPATSPVSRGRDDNPRTARR